jgi:hypothetical protein
MDIRYLYLPCGKRVEFLRTSNYLAQHGAASAPPLIVANKSRYRINRVSMRFAVIIDQRLDRTVGADAATPAEL